MNRLEILDGSTLPELLAAPKAVLMLSKTDCAACIAWTEELSAALEDASLWPDVRFGKVFLDKPGLAAFKKANPWLAEVHDLPYMLIYANGERFKAWAGGGRERLANRLAQLPA
jgi:hypothetical protein